MTDAFAAYVAAGIDEIRAARLVDLAAEHIAASDTYPEEEFTPTEIDAMADIVPEDLEDARTDWYVSTDPAAARLLDAREL